MAFKVALSPTYQTKIVVETPNNNGKFDKSDFMAEFKRVSFDDLDELRKLPQKEVLEKVLVGWSGLVDEGGSEVHFNPLNVAVVLQIPQAFTSLYEGFWSSIFRAKEKN
ncbi:hypothetical protein HHL21_14525 [Massilia sp. RP-1-19]|uniref:Uncharacterized protein n=1 Tax=Massilia polaris TaxID=2728846 RepID=A0A848HQ76_9BURK|nr:hypothetical protein [Massilia polaris]NML62269.1 hypothetical protein [Massilia polaris]